MRGCVQGSHGGGVGQCNSCVGGGGEVKDDNDNNNAPGGKRGEQCGLDDHNNNDNDGNHGNDEMGGPHCHRRHGGRCPLPFATEDQRLACWALSNLTMSLGTRPQ
jgi:hypothetical protein